MDLRFNGRSRNARVDMAQDRGPSRDESLKGIREAREQRQRQNQRHKASTSISACWKGFATRLRLWKDNSDTLASISPQAAPSIGEEALRKGLQCFHFMPSTAIIRRRDSALVVLGKDSPAIHRIGVDLSLIVSRAVPNLNLLLQRPALAAEVFEVLLRECNNKRASGDRESGGDQQESQLYQTCARLVQVLPTTGAARLARHWRYASWPGPIPLEALRLARECIRLQGVKKCQVLLHALFATSLNAVTLATLSSSRTGQATTLSELLLGATPSDDSMPLEIEKDLREFFLQISDDSPGGRQGSPLTWCRVALLCDLIQPESSKSTSTPLALFTRKWAQCDVNTLVPALIKGIEVVDREGDSTRSAVDPLALIYSPRFVEWWCKATFSAEELNHICRIYIEPYLRYSGSPDRQRQAISLVTYVAAIPGFIRHLYVTLSLWGRSGVGSARSTDIGAPVATSASTSFVDLLFLTVFGAIFGSGSREEYFSTDLLTQSEVKDLVSVLKGFVFRSYVQGCLDDGAKELAAAASRLLCRLHTVDESIHFMSAGEWTVSNSSYPVEVGQEQWSLLTSSSGAVARIHAGLPLFYGAASATPPPFLAGTNPHGARDDSDDDNREGFESSPTGPLPFDSKSPLAVRMGYLLLGCPFLIPFQQRMQLTRGLMLSQREMGWTAYSEDEEIKVRRDRLFDDAFVAMQKLSPAKLRNRTRVRFLDPSGTPEAGYGEGVFREFMFAVCKDGFSPANGLFVAAADGSLYPRPHAQHFVGVDHLERLRFLGRMVGKALREGILLDIPFALFFRNQILGRVNGLSELSSLDPELFKSVTKLLTMQKKGEAEQISDLCLSFSTTIEVLGVTIELPLVRGGKELPVTIHNVKDYALLFADFKLNRENKKQADAFRSGLFDIVEENWLKVFDANELQFLLRGADEATGLDVEDWKQHTHYGHGYDESSPPVQHFWAAVRSMTPQEQRSVLRFVTSVSRAPLFGFQHMSPPFTIAKSGDDSERLPSAATCMCLLKLPPYRNPETCRRKLLQAAQEGLTFELS
jgi:hypothetical protein